MHRKPHYVTLVVLLVWIAPGWSGPTYQTTTLRYSPSCALYLPLASFNP
jgi:hypothetical protein